MKLEHTFVLLTKVNSKWLKYLNIRQDKIKLLEENIGKTFCDINSTNVFLGQSPKTIEGEKSKNKQMELIKLITFAEQRKVTIKKTKRLPMDWEKIFTNDATNKDLIFKTYKYTKYTFQ